MQNGLSRVVSARMRPVAVVAGLAFGAMLIGRGFKANMVGESASARNGKLLERLPAVVFEGSEDGDTGWVFLVGVSRKEAKAYRDAMSSGRIFASKAEVDAYIRESEGRVR